MLSRVNDFVWIDDVHRRTTVIHKQHFTGNLLIYRPITILWNFPQQMRRYYSPGNFTLIKMDLWPLIQLVNEKGDSGRYLATAEFRASPPAFLATIYLSHIGDFLGR